ncbi:hypothetical protein [Streptomyces sp. SPB162]|uniref:hypothetical protein n=1 Tax=Streptomyces sp. SPB162 TaxID=2940560 RepID=UPI002A51344F|nr:hypothetical protein [Streptomyces sp. SPB162]
MDIAVVVLLLLFASFVAVGAVATVRTVRAVKRGVERGSAQARRVVEDTALKARRYTLMGAAGELAQLRLALRTSIDSTYRALDAGSAEDASLSEAASLLARLNDHARVLDTELKVLEREPDKGRIADRLPSLAERTERITHSADALRWAAQDRARQFADDDLTSLAQQIDIEAGALRHWAPTTLPTGGSSASIGDQKRISRS